MRKRIEILGFCFGWFAVLVQFILMIQNRQASIPETIIRFFSYFTILTNILVSLYFTQKLFTTSTNLFAVFAKKGALTALTAFILIVGLVYQLVLRGMWKPEGMQFIVDELLHTIIPLFTLIYWFMYATKEKLSLFDVGIWLLYPVIYLLLILLRGSFSNFYPYPFLNISEIGIEKTLLNVGLVFLLILGVFGILIVFKNQSIKKINR